MDKVTELTIEQMYFAIACFERYITMAKKDQNNLWNDIDHSSLLRRLLLGKKVFKYPPPLSLSYPAYELLENGSMQCEAFKLNSVLKGHTGQDMMIINQHGYKIISDNGNEEYELEYGDRPYKFILKHDKKDDKFFQWTLYVKDYNEENSS